MGSLWRDIIYLFRRRDLLRFTLLLVILVLNSLLELAALAAVPAFIAVLLAGTEGANIAETGTATALLLRLSAHLGATSAAQRLWAAGGIVVLVNALRVAWMYTGIWLQARMLSHRRVEISLRLLSAYMLAPAAFISRRNTNDLVNRAVNESERLVNEFLNYLLQAVQYSIVILCIIALLLVTIPQMTLCAVAGLAVFGGGFMLHKQLRQKQLGKEEQQRRTDAISQASEAINAKTDAAILGCRGHFLKRFRLSLEQAADARRRHESTLKFIWPYLEFVSLCVLMAVTLVELIRCGGDFNAVAPQIALLGVALVRLRSYAINLLYSTSALRYNRASLSVVTEDLKALERTSLPQKAIAAGDAAAPCSFNACIEFKAVTFTYPEAAKPALENISLRIPKGAAIGIAGTTGGGKSTLIQLLTGAFTPDQGEITIDGKAITELGLAWQHCIGYVPQNIFLLDDTLEANIAVGVPEGEISQERLTAALRTAQLEEFVSAHPDGIRMTLGEDGVRLSGGQRQRIGIARALYRQPQVLLFDEATSALDNATETAFTGALESLRGKCTTVTVAHRLSTIRNCDLLFLFEDGKLIGSGTYDELMKSSPHFQNLAQSAKD